MIETRFENVFGAPPASLVGLHEAARQFSPLVPGADRLTQTPRASLGDLAMLAPPGAIERRRAIALALLALRFGAPFAVLAQKDKGGSRLAGELSDLGCSFEESARRHHRICWVSGPGDAAAIERAIGEGAPRFGEELGLWTQPGVFSWNRIDPGSALLLRHLPLLRGRGADFGCGLGVLSRAALACPELSHLTLIDLDRRAIDMAKRNIDDPRAEFLWSDARGAGLSRLDFVVMNPPFHDGGVEDRSLGQAFIQSAARALRTGGVLWLTANRHLPYEGVMKPLFREAVLLAQEGGYKIYRAQK